MRNKILSNLTTYSLAIDLFRLKIDRYKDELEQFGKIGRLNYLLDETLTRYGENLAVLNTLRPDSISPVVIFNFYEFEQKVCRWYGVDASTVRMTCRKREIAQARQLLMTVSNTLNNESLAFSGARYGKDHATVLHAKKVVKINLVSADHWSNKMNEFCGSYVFIYDNLPITMYEFLRRKL
jgi:hypothetical protein